MFCRTKKIWQLMRTSKFLNPIFPKSRDNHKMLSINFDVGRTRNFGGKVWGYEPFDIDHHIQNYRILYSSLASSKKMIAELFPLLQFSFMYIRMTHSEISILFIIIHTLTYWKWLTHLIIGLEKIKYPLLPNGVTRGVDVESP